MSRHLSQDGRKNGDPFACGVAAVPRRRGWTARDWTADPRKVTCNNCARTRDYEMAVMQQRELDVIGATKGMPE